MVSPPVGVGLSGANMDLELPAAKQLPVSEYTVAPGSQAEVFMRAAEFYGLNALNQKGLPSRFRWRNLRHALATFLADQVASSFMMKI
jgi:hypothetical protein